jgi:hypothetical protein
VPSLFDINQKVYSDLGTMQRPVHFLDLNPIEYFRGLLTRCLIKWEVSGKMVELWGDICSIYSSISLYEYER